MMQHACGLEESAAERQSGLYGLWNDVLQYSS